MTKRELGLNVCWLLALSVPSAAGVWSCVANARTGFDYALGLLSAVILVGALVYFVPKYKVLKPKEFMDNSSLVLFASYVPAAIALPEIAAVISALLYPLIVYFFMALLGDLREWAAKGEK